MSDGIGRDGIGSKGSYYVNQETKDMSLEHHIDTFNYNLQHAEDHLKEAEKACHLLEKAGKAGEVVVPKSLLDLFKYFEDTKDDENTAEMSMDKLKDKVKKASESAEY